jgi:hypothetical protein
MTSTMEPTKGKKAKGKGAKGATPTTPTTKDSRIADVTAVLANIDQGEALRDRIKAMTAELKVHEDMVKDALGEATTGVDNKGHVVVRYPERNRSGLSKEKVKDRLTPTEYAECETTTSYRTLLYGEG